ARLTVDGKRRLTVEAGDIYLIVAKAPAPFVVTTAHGTATAMGTRFGLSVGAKTLVAVAQGVVKLDGEAGTVDVAAGQQGELAPGQRPTRAPAPRLSYIVSWARDALAQVSRLVEKAKRDSGELVAKDPWGQEVRLTLRKYHVDVHIEDGIARTTIDQTYFNHMPWQIEGTFYFPLPPDASVSRLAMYVNGTLNEGGMVSRERGQQIYTEIKFQRRDPALLEMQEGNVFKMRIFPIEGRQEKRIFLSYTQKLDELYGTLRYWFPMDHTHSNAREVGIHVRAKGAAGKYVAESSTHELGINEDGGDLVMNWHAKDVKPDQDLLLHLLPTEQAARRSFTTCEKDGTTYVFGRVTPSLPGEVKPQPRQWIVLNDVSASRTRLEVQAQSYILERLLAEADDGDTIALVNLNTKAQVVGAPFLSVRAPAAKGLLEAATVDLPLGGTHIAAGLEAAARLITQHTCANPHILYLGDGVATDGKTEVDLLLKRIPQGATFVGIGVGKKADQRFLQAAADQTGGLFALINPDEDIDWRVFDLVAALNTPRLVGITARFENAAGRAADIIAYPSARALADGETLFVVGRTQGRAPAWLVLEGTVGDERLEHRYALADARTDGAFIPRFWAKRHIDELLKSGTEHKDEIVKLSMQYYVMTPYTSLIVLEDDKMYEQYKVERGRSDHWALYPAPRTIKVVKEPLDRSQYDWYWGYQSEDGKVKAKARPTSIKDIVESVQFRINAPFYFWRPQRLGQGRFALYNLVDLDADPSGLLAWLVNKAGVTPTGAAGGPAGQKQPAPSRRYDEPPTTPVSAEMMPPALILARGERSRRSTFTSFYFQPDALPQFDVKDIQSASRLSHEFGTYGDYETRFSRLSSASGLVRAAESLPSSILSLGADYDERIIAPLGLLVDDSRSMQFKKVLAPATLAGGATAGGKFGGYLGFLPPQLQFRFERALGERRGRIQHDVREYNRRWGGYGWDGGGWYYGSAWNSLDLRKGHSARLYGGLEGLKEDDEALPPLAMTSAASQPMPAGAIMAGKRLYTPSLAIAVYGQAIKTVPGTGPALAADFLIPRRDALLKKARDEKDEKILKAIQAALDGLEAAYPRFEDSGVFWGHQGWNYRPQPWTFQPPQVQCHQWYNWSFDLTRYASALYSTNADVLNEVVAAYPQKAAGTVSDEARQLIAAARQAIQPVRIRFGESGPAMLVAAGGRFALTRTTDMYLEERMVCDGKAIVHLYPELGLAARRAATPLRLAALRRVAPHLIEPADWLARRYEVTLAEPADGRFVLKLAPIAHVAQPSSAVKPPFHILLVANTDGRIREKSLFVKGKLQLKLAYAYDAGKVTARWSDGEGKELATASFAAEPFEPKPDTFAADLATFVVIDMPLRRPSYYEAQISKLEKGADKLLPSLYRHLALAHIQELNWRRWGGQNPKVLEAVKKLAEVVGKTADGQLALKLGDITLLGSAGQRHIAAQWVAKSGIPKDHPVLAYYELMRQGWQKMDSLSSRVADGIVGHLAAYHAAFAEGQNKKAGTKAIDRFLKDFADSPLAFAIVWYRSQWHNRHGEWTRLFDHPRWRSLAILMAAQRANTPALRKQVAEAFAKLH
ncbi:FecR domain-containing protein, partial [bacterium]|nr:FecR domain-containing protein [bacterium]